MSTRARVRMTDYDGEEYCYSIGCDGYPSGVIPKLPDAKVSYEKLRKEMNLDDFFELMPDYLYEIDLPKEYVRIYRPDRSKYRWENGELKFEGTIAQAKAKYPA